MREETDQFVYFYRKVSVKKYAHYLRGVANHYIPEPPERKRSRLGYEALRGTGTAADVLVGNRKAFERRLQLHAPPPEMPWKGGDTL